MKLKQRITIVLLSLCGVMMVAFMYIDSVQTVSHVLIQNDRSVTVKSNNEQSLLRTFNEIKIHLPLEDKNNNYNSDSSLLQFLQVDKTFKNKRNVDLLIRAAHLLEQNRSLHKAAPNIPNIVLSHHTLEQLDLYRNKVSKSSLPQQRRNRKMSVYSEPENELSSWKRFHNHISKYELYSANDPVVDELVNDLVSLPIQDMIQKSGGTQLKLIFFYTSDDIDRAMWKPMRFSREQETLPDHFYFTDYERHNAEIAAFHLDRILRFHRVPPTAGRLINVTHDIRRHADKKLLKTFFTSPAGNICFHGDCDYYCDTSHAVCGHPEMMEGSFAAMLPSSDTITRTTWRHPWRRSYHKRNKAVWENANSSYCDSVRQTEPYTSTTRMLYLMDMAVFDFLMGNQDRHHYETFTNFDNNTFTLHLDNGRGFGRSNFDDLSILMPMSQCCMVRLSTFGKLLDFERGKKKLSEVMKESLKKDKLNPILTESHLLALDRRVRIILRTINKCIDERKDYQRVIIDDGH